MGGAPSVLVTAGRLVLGLLAAPLCTAVFCLMACVTAPWRVWQLCLGEDEDERKASLARVALAVILTPLATGLGAVLGAVVGVLAGPLWAAFGFGAPEHPFSWELAHTHTRRDAAREEERHAVELREQCEKEGVVFTEGKIAYECKREGKDHSLHVHRVAPAWYADGVEGDGGKIDVKMDGGKELRGLLIVQHGLHSHGGAPRTLKVAVHFAKKGFLVYLPDSVGHGRSTGDFAVVQSFDHIAENLAHVADTVVARHPGLPLYLQGESMGGMLVLYAPHHMKPSTYANITGIVSTCPGIMIHDDAGSKGLEQLMKLLPMKAMKATFPHLPVAPGPRGNIFPTDPALGVPAQALVDEDPLEYTKDTKFATASTFAEVLLVAHERRAFVRRLQQLEKAVLLCHGTADKCVDIEASRELYAGLASKKKKFIQYVDKCHVLLCEDEPTTRKYLNDMSAFVEATLVAESPA